MALLGQVFDDGIVVVVLRLGAGVLAGWREVFFARHVALLENNASLLDRLGGSGV
jgi:hypothetical protein